MIVKCEQCQTRFKVPDEKVTADRGVKVRCTKCNNTFRVMKDGTQLPVGAGSGSGSASASTFLTQPDRKVDPFEKFGTPVSSGGEETRPGVFSLGVEATRMPALGEPEPPSPPEAPVTRGSVFDFGSLSPPLPQPPTQQIPALQAAQRITAVIQRHPPPETSAAPTNPHVPAPFDFSNLGAGPAPSNNPTLPMGGAAPFDFSSLGPAPAGPSTAQTHPALVPPATKSAFDFSTLGPPPSATVEVPLPTLPPPPGATTNPALPPGLFDDVPSLHDPSAALTASGMPALGDLPPPSTMPAARSGSSVGDDFFAPVDVPVPSAPPPSAPADDSRASLFDMAAALPSAPPDEEEPAPTLPPPDPEDLVDAPVPKVQLPRRLQPSDQDLASVGPRGSRRRTLMGVVVNVAIALILVAALVVVGSAYVNDGKLDSRTFSAERLKGLLSPPSTLVARDISNGLYDTRSGRPVFFVRGEVLNRGKTSQRVKVRAEILEGDALVRSAEVYAGASPSPEELHNLGAVDELEKLNTRLSANAGPLAPGASAPFLVTFFEYPPDLKAFRVRVAASAGAKQTAAR